MSMLAGLQCSPFLNGKAHSDQFTGSKIFKITTFNLALAVESLALISRGDGWPGAAGSTGSASGVRHDESSPMGRSGIFYLLILHATEMLER